MAKSKNIKLRGIAKWAKLFDANIDKEGYKGAYKDCEGAYTIDLGLTEEEFAKLKESGSQKRGKEADGLIWVKLIRKNKHKIPELGGAPKVYDKSGAVWDYDTNGAIGNGSTVTVLANVYKAGDVVGTRIEKVQVLKAVEFADDGFLEIEGDIEDTGTTEDTPAAEFEDEIPF